MVVFVIVIGILMNLIVFLLYYRLEKFNKENNSSMEIVPFKGIYKNDVFVDGQVSIQIKEVVTVIPQVKTFDLSKENGRGDVAFAVGKAASIHDNIADIKKVMVPICDCKIGLADEKNMYKLYFQLGKN